MSIKVAIITPASHLEQFSSHGDIEMVLSHLVVPDAGFHHSDYVKQNYVKYYRQRAAEGKWTILDNSAYEIGKLEATQASGQGLGPEIVLQAAEIIKPSIVIAQDVLCDRVATYESTKAFIKYVKDKGMLGQFEIMAVAQGKSEDEWLSSFEELASLPEVNQIGLSKVSVPLSFGDKQDEDGCVSKARLKCTKKLATEILNEKWLASGGHDIPKIHLLGGDNWLPWELHQQRRYPWIFSNDSSATVWYGGYGNEIYNPSTGKIERIITEKPDLENNTHATSSLMDLGKAQILHNIATLHRFSK